MEIRAIKEIYFSLVLAELGSSVRPKCALSFVESRWVARTGRGEEGRPHGGNEADPSFDIPHAQRLPDLSPVLGPLPRAPAALRALDTRRCPSSFIAASPSHGKPSEGRSHDRSARQFIPRA